ncbi:MAG: AsmA family protein [Bacteroidales bacterium]|nr:AsmA family protein [Bacteroidales bacterium]
MKKFFKIFAIVLIVLIAVIILIPIIFKGKIIEMAQEEANKNLNAKVEFADLNVSLIKNFPNISAEIEDLSIAGVDTFRNDTLVTFKKFKAVLNLMSVISGDEIKVKRILLDEPNINVIVLEDGTANYDIALEDTTATEEEVPTETDTTESNFQIALKKFEIKNANIKYDDRQGDVYAELENLNFLLKGDMTEDLTNLDLLLQIDSVTVKSGGVRYLKKAKVVFDSELKADLENSIYTFKENEFQLNEIKLGFDGFVEMPAEDIIMDMTFETKESNFKDVLSLVPAVYMTDFEGVETSGEFKFSGYAKGTYNDLIMPAFGIDLLVKNGYFKYPDLPKSVKDINISVKVDAKEGTGDDMTIDLKKASITMAGNPVSMFAFINMTAADVSMNGNVKGKIDLNSVKDVVPVDDTELSGIVKADLNFKGNLSDIENENYEKFDANGNLTLEKISVTMEDVPKVDIKKADMDFSPQFVDLKQFDATVGKSDLHLKGRIDNLISYVFKEELLTGTFNFTSNLLDLNELTASSSEEGAGGEEASGGESSGDETGADSEIVEIPDNIDFTLNSSLKKVLYDELTITNLVGLIIIKDSKLDMKQLRMNMLGGSMNLSGSYDTKKLDKPVADLSMNISNFNIPQVYQAFMTIQDYVPIAENCTGDISANINLNTILDNEMMPVLNTLNSSGNLNSNNISIKDNRLFNNLAKVTKQNKYKSPRLSNFDIAYTVKDGNLTVEESDFKIAGTEVTLGGTQNIDRSLDFDLGMIIPNSIAGNLISNIPVGSSKKDVDVTANIGGTSTDPKIVGFTSSLTEDIIDEVKEKVEEKIEEVKENVKEKADQILKDARKKADRVIAEAENQAKNIRSNAKKAGDRLISEAGSQGDKLIREARNPIAKKAAELSKKELVKNAKNQATNLNNKADKEANNVIKAANTKADKIMSDANTRANKL